MIQFTDMEVAGLLPMMFNEYDERSAREQADANYQHGGGWRKFDGFIFYDKEPGYAFISYQGDPDTLELSRAQLRDETIILFEHSWVAIVQPDGQYEIARMD